MNPVKLLEKYYRPGSTSYRILLHHSRAVAEKAVAICKKTGKGNTEFVRQAAMLHDIGILETDAPQLGCHGALPYLCHGFKGREILEREGYHQHALVCDRHIGVGLTADEIAAGGLPLPVREMSPKTDEEKIIAYADLFFSKSPTRPEQIKSVDEVIQGLERFGQDKVAIFNEWHALFGA